MVITDKHLRDQCKRLSSVPLANMQSVEGKQEIFDVLKRHCESNEHVTATMTRFLEDEEGLKNPIAAFVRIARQVREAEIEAAKAPAGCESCRGTGWYRYTRFVRPSDMVDGYEAEFSTFCTCEAGVWRKSKVQGMERK